MAGRGKGRKADRQFGESSRPRFNHPPSLKGRKIGLWYARKRKRGPIDPKENNKAQLMKINKKPLGSILISSKKKQHINQLLNESASLYPSTFLKKTNSYEHLQETKFKQEYLQNITGNILEKIKSKSTNLSSYRIDSLNTMFLEDLNEKHSSSFYREMQAIRRTLPAMGMKDEIINLVNENQVVVISGETGCGKTTQVAQFILDDYIMKGKGAECKIMCTQPRRISAISVAERVAKERDEKLGRSVGFQIRLEKTMPRERGSILFCTTGILLKFMEGDPSLSKVSHLVLDEIHERDVSSDFLITLLKNIIQYNSHIKIILMSATLNSEAFSKYYDNAPHVTIPGFTFPVEEYFLEDALQLTGFRFPEKREPKSRSDEWRDFCEPYFRQLEAEKKYSRDLINELRKPNSEEFNIYLIMELIKVICNKSNDDGAILVFVPGFVQIKYITSTLSALKQFSPSKYIIIPLHSQLPTVDQKRIFHPAPKGMRKIIIATNIAETSITIDDVTTVIDSGYIKISNLDPETGIETLKAEWVSQANASQRKGRAGRVKAGVCYHLITKVRYQLLDKFMKPEVLRKRLDDVILQLKILQLGEAEPFLAQLMDPPESVSVQASLNLLARLGALDSDENLTPLGFHMAKLPVGAQCSKMLILAALFSCLDPILSVVASLGFKDAFQLSTTDSRDADKKKLELSAGTNSDHLCLHYAIRGFEDSDNPRGFCRKYYLSSSILTLLIDMRKQFAQQLFEMKFTKDQNPRSFSSNLNSNNISLVKAVIAAGLYPNVAILKKIYRSRVALTNVLGDKMKFHLSSVLSQIKSAPSPLFVYHLRLRSSSLFVFDGTMVFPLPIVFFGDQFRMHNSEDNQEQFNGVSVNGTMRFICSESTSLIIQMLRDRLNHILEWKLSHPGFVNWESDSPELKMLKIIMDLITTEDNENLDLSDYEDV